jgi:hypothetical protein
LTKSRGHLGDTGQSPLRGGLVVMAAALIRNRLDRGIRSVAPMLATQRLGLCGVVIEMAPGSGDDHPIHCHAGLQRPGHDGPRGWSEC